jgi:hypothetical protein
MTDDVGRPLLVTPDGSVLLAATPAGVEMRFVRRTWRATCARGGKAITVHGTINEAFDAAAAYFGARRTRSGSYLKNPRKPKKCKRREPSTHASVRASDTENRMHVIRITSVLNSPDGEPWSFDLAEKVLITGRNGTHKSSIPIALQIALGAMADGVDGRDSVKDRARLFEMAPGDELWCAADISDGRGSRWGARMVDGTIKVVDNECLFTDDTDIFPLRGIREVLYGDWKIARRRFLTWVGAMKTTEDMLASLPSHLHARYRDISEAKAKVKDAPDTPVAMLSAVTEYATARAREIEREAKGADVTVQLLHPEGARPSDEAVVEAQRVVDAWRVALDACIRYETWQAASAGAANREATTTALAQADRALVGWQAAHRAAEAQEVPAVVVTQGMTRLQAAQGLLDLAAGEANCPVCSSAVGATHLENCRAFFANQATALQTATAEAVAQARGARDQHDLAVREAAQAVAGWYVEATRLRGLLAATPQGEAPPNPGMTSDHARTQQTGAQVALNGLRASHTQWDNLSRARAVACALRAEKPAYEDLAKSCQKAVGELLAASEADFTKRVQRWLGEGCIFGMDLGTTDRPALRFGFVQNGVLRTYKSTAQSEILRVALTMAVCELASGRKRKGTETPLRIIIPDDRRVDPENLQAQMRAWARFPGQVILEATEKPGRISKDWQHIDMDEWLAKRMPKAQAAEPVAVDGAPVAAEVPTVADNGGREATAPPASMPALPVPSVSVVMATMGLLPPPAPAQASAGLPLPPPMPSPFTAVDRGHLHALGYASALAPNQAAYVVQNGVPAILTKILEDGTLRIFNAAGRPTYDIRPEVVA